MSRGIPHDFARLRTGAEDDRDDRDDGDGWHRWPGVNGIYYAQKLLTSPPLVVRADGDLALQAEMALADCLGPGDYARYKAGQPLLNGQPPQAPAPALPAHPPTLVPGPVPFSRSPAPSCR